MAFCDNLIYLRKKHGLTQEDLAERFEVSRQAVSKWETGESLPETEKLIDMCDRFSVSLDELLRGDLTKEKTPPAEVPFVPAPAEDDNGETPQVHAEEKPVARYYSAGKIKSALNGSLFLLTVAAFLLVGCVWNLWHPGWLAFMYYLSLVCLVDAIVPLVRGRGRDFGGFIILFATSTYLLMGFVWGLWHPGWIIFIAAIALIAALETFARRSKFYKRNR